MPSKNQPQKLNLEEHAIPQSRAHKEVVLWAKSLDDAERVRIALAHRSDKLAEGDSGLHATLFTVIAQEAKGFVSTEKSLGRRLTSAMKEHELYDYIRRVPGIGEKSIGRLLGEIGVPAHRRPYARMLLNYAGLMCDEDGQAVKLKRGQKSTWKNDAKKRAWILVDPIIKNRCQNCTDHGNEIERQMQRARYEEIVAESGEMPAGMTFDAIREFWESSATSKSKRKWPKGANLDVNRGWIAPPNNCQCWEEGRVYHALYDQTKMKYTGTTLKHERKGYYGDDGDGQIGDPRTGKHIEAITKRKVATQILIDLWIASRWSAGLPAFASPTMLQLYGDDVPWELHEAGRAQCKTMDEWYAMQQQAAD